MYFNRKTTIEGQGRLFAVARSYRDGVKRPLHTVATKRGIIKGFSKGSRRRLLRLVARLEVKGKRALFITLTYPGLQRDPVPAKAHMRAFLKRIKHRCPDASAIWRMEYQQRGAIHFHLIVFNVKGIKWNAPIGEPSLQEWWCDITETTARNSVDVDRVQNERKAMSYVGKYVAKCDSDNGFIPLPYLAAVVLSRAGTSANGTISPLLLYYLLTPAGYPPGRLWGVQFRNCLPYDLRYVQSLDLPGFSDVHVQLKRAVRRYTRGRLKMSGRYESGFVLFTDRLDQWLRYAHGVTVGEFGCRLE